MEIYEHDKTHKAFYVFPFSNKPFKVGEYIKEVARSKHILQNSLKMVIGYTKGNVLFLEPTKGGKKVVVVYRARK